MNEKINSPYTAPDSDLATPHNDDAVELVKKFSAKGRIGRLRYLAYQMAYMFGLYAIVALAFVLGMQSDGFAMVAGIFVFVAYIALVVLYFMLTIQRCHDFDKTGWLSLLALIPLVGLIFFFWPGTLGGNTYGARTPPNTKGVILLAFVLPIIVAVTLAAIAIPAYSSYVEKAKLTEATQSMIGPKLATTSYNSMRYL